MHTADDGWCANARSWQGLRDATRPMPGAEWHREYLGNMLVQDVVNISASPQICKELGLGVPMNCTTIAYAKKNV
jgi:hypothetical protein